MPREEETDIGGPKRGFTPTLWTVVMRAKDHQDPGRQNALEELLKIYWKPVYFFVRRRGHNVEFAKDLTQSFFAAFLEKDFLKSVSPQKGRFRTFLMAALSHFLSNEYDRARAKKRGGHLKFVEAEEDLASADSNPERAFFCQWATEVIARGTSRLRAETPPEDFRLLSGDAPPGMKVSVRKNRVHRLRVRLRELLREEIIPSVEDPAEAEEELRELLSSFS